MANRWKGIKMACEWIALNDDPEETDPENIAGYMTVHMLCDCTGQDRGEMARWIADLRTGVIPFAFED